MPKLKNAFDDFLNSVERDSEAETLVAYRKHFRLEVIRLRKSHEIGNTLPGSMRHLD